MEAGRDPYSARVYSLLTIVTAETSEQARAKYADYLAHADDEGALVLNSGWMGIDLSVYDPEEPVGNVESNAIRSVVAGFRQSNNDGREWTIRDIGRYTSIGGLGATIVGSGEEIADQLQDWVAETDVDGFNLAYAITPGTFADIVEHVVPVLQARGVYPTSYEDGTLRQRLLGRGDRLPDEHRGANFRIDNDDVREKGVA